MSPHETSSSRRRPRFGLALQIGGAFALVVAILIAVGMTGIAQLNRQGTDDQKIMTAIYESDAQIKALGEAMWQVRAQGLRMRAMDESEIPDAWATQQELYAAFEEEIAAIVAVFDEQFGVEIPGHEDNVAVWLAYKDAQASLYDPAYVGEPVDAATRTELGNELVEIINGLTSISDEQIVAAVAEGESKATAASVLLMSAQAVGVAAAVALGIWLTRRILRSATKVKDSLEAMADGDLTIEADVHSNDEMGDMATALGTAQGALRETMAEVISSAQTVAAAAEELSAANAQVAAGSQETSAQAGVVANAADEVNRNVQAVASGAEQMGASIKEISHNANEAARVAANATSVAQSANEQVGKLGISSQEIGNVIKVITGIAEQTNLLALNATIEAARAGEAGKGFAVVAGEVKDLAQETQKATEEVARRVAAIQGDTGGAVDAIGQISEIVKQISDFQMTIASAVEEQTATTGEMSRGVAEAATGSADIAGNISSVAQASADSAQVLDQIGASVNELAELSANLRSKVEQFTY